MRGVSPAPGLDRACTFPRVGSPGPCRCVSGLPHMSGPRVPTAVALRLSQLPPAIAAHLGAVAADQALDDGALHILIPGGECRAAVTTRSNVTSTRRLGRSGSRIWPLSYIYPVRIFSGARGERPPHSRAMATKLRPQPLSGKVTTPATVPRRRLQGNSVSRRQSRSSTINPSAGTHRR